ncbi:MAG: hypothetical protein MUF58_09290 [Arcicella sp.]|nr:hypothetical protein [Arcicella sp.]
MNQLTLPLSNVQVELLKLYSTNLQDSELEDLKLTLAKFYAKRSIKSANKIWDERGLTNEDMNQWLNEDLK